MRKLITILTGLTLLAMPLSADAHPGGWHGGWHGGYYAGAPFIGGVIIGGALAESELYPQVVTPPYTTRVESRYYDSYRGNCDVLVTRDAYGRFVTRQVVCTR